MAINSIGDTVAAADARRASGGLRQLVGTRILAAMEVSESVLQEALRSIHEMPRSLSVTRGECEPDRWRYSFTSISVWTADGL